MVSTHYFYMYVTVTTAFIFKMNEESTVKNDLRMVMSVAPSSRPVAMPLLSKKLKCLTKAVSKHYVTRLLAQTANLCVMVRIPSALLPFSAFTFKTDVTVTNLIAILSCNMVT